ncbi:universal stress protein [Thermodesulforhabdus norvegica]|uniref:Nucleotide-binding universal stress protein, UspA family n=1 Tax=Thermodesulforhabdus norvegica TaxID=39841 RepID=A0A1I4QL83_9BACT|nr:universal stress protein [Thermodesulforhabdus norvegica]SFM40445.1 Nucleotide-binding universal stress protein, UspA family [Thermodesulforhabdus norvegica]
MNCPVCGEEVRREKSYCERCAFVYRPVPGEGEASYSKRLALHKEMWAHIEKCPHTSGPLPGEHKILFCTDLYASSDFAFKAAVDLARECNGELIVFHVLESRHRYSGHVITADGETWPSSEVFERLKKSLHQYYSAKMEPGTPVKMRIEAKGGIPWVEIVRFARREKTDMIVMGPYSIKDPSQNGFNLERPHLGETASKVSLRAHCPVAIVTSPDQRLSLEETTKKQG